MKKIIFYALFFILIFVFTSCNQQENKKEFAKSVMIEADKTKYKNTMKDLKLIATAVEFHKTDKYMAPEDLTFGGENIRSFYEKNFPETDAWGNKWYYKRDPKNTYVYWIGSAGSDGKFNGFNQKGNYSNLNGNDIIYSNGAFVYCPSKVTELSSNKKEIEKGLAPLINSKNRKKVVKSLKTAILNSKYRATVFDLEAIADYVESLRTDNMTPEDLTFSGINIPSWQKQYLTETDYWGNKWYYKRDPKNTDVYWIGSAGSDGVFNGFNQKGVYSELKNNDIIYSNGAFVYCSSWVIEYYSNKKKL